MGFVLVAEGCSGHGTCEYIEELASDFADRRNGPGNKNKDLTCNSQLDSDPATGAGHNCGLGALVTTYVTARTANTDKYSGHQYRQVAPLLSLSWRSTTTTTS